MKVPKKAIAVGAGLLAAAGIGAGAYAALGGDLPVHGEPELAEMSMYGTAVPEDQLTFADPFG